MYKIFVNCKRLQKNLIFLTMRTLILFLFLVSFFSCEKNETNDVLPNVSVNETINLNLPQYIDLQTPGGSVYSLGGIKGIFIKNTGLTPKFKAYERACPNYDCTTPMTFDGIGKMKCPCDLSEYSILDGSPQTRANLHYAREYKVNAVNASSLIITNY
jgi:nitrite reductase/ring-hydroxylating ferredoxin subunit